MELTVDSAISWMARANEAMQANKDYLTKLDQAIGDGDHGINMARGFDKVASKLDAQSYTSVDTVIKDIAMTLMSEIGGASGPLYATAFLRWSSAVKGMEQLDQTAFSDGLTAAVNGIKQRGNATESEKTMVDVWSPMAAFFAQNENIRAEAIENEAKTAMEQSKDMQATKGRASYFKEQSIGHIDPGCASSYFLFKALADVMKGNE